MPPILTAPPGWGTLSNTVPLWHGCTGHDAAQIRRPPYIDPAKGRPNTDFGQGFYTTTIERQARQWAWHRYYSLPLAKQGGGNTPVVLRFDVPREKLSALDTLSFVLGDFDNEAFWSLVHYCRGSTPAKVLDHLHPIRRPDRWYDVVVGPVAAIWRQRVAMLGADQVSFHTRAAAGVLNDVIRAGDYRMDPVV